ncbi:MAG: O-antigen ligase family protein [Planctomycetales bacterium]|nr:O-antigen ligase family protein [Planctomycetales bacterium]
MNKRTKRERKSSATIPRGHAVAVASGQQGLNVSSRLWPASAAALGALLVWLFLAPMDSISVFVGQAQSQNLAWLLTGTLAASAAAFAGAGFSFSRTHWIGLLLVLGWLILATVLAGRQDNPRVAWYGFWHVMSLVSGYFVCRGCAKGDYSRTAMLSICLCGQIALSVHGLHQMAVSMPRDRAKYQEDPQAVMQQYGITTPIGSPEHRRLEDRLLNSSEPFATFALANSLAASLCMALVLLLGMAVHWTANRKALPSSSWTALGLLVAIGFVSATWFFAKSRGASAGVFVALVYWLFLDVAYYRKRLSTRQMLIGLGAFVSLACVAAAWLYRFDRLVLTQAYYSLSFRLEYWVATLRMLREHWLFGVGLGNFQAHYSLVKLEGASETIADPHNWILDIAATLSAPIAALCCVWMAMQLIPRKKLASQSAASDKERASNDYQMGKMLLSGAVVGGIICSIGLYFLTGLDVEASVLSWTVALCLTWAVWPLLYQLASIRSAALPSAVLAATVALLANGSWQASGLAVPLLVLIVAAQPDPQREQTVAHVRPWVLALPALGLVCFIFQSWVPTTNSWTIQQQMVDASGPEQLRLVDAAIAADSLDSRPLQWKAELLVMQALESSRDQFAVNAENALEAVERWLACDSTSFGNWFMAGESMLQLSVAASRADSAPHEWLTRALDYFTGAIVRNPTDVQLQLQAALVANLLGDETLASRLLSEGQRLSDITPHADKKLEMQVFQLPPPLAEKILTELGSNEDSAYLTGEQVARWLRRNN